MLSFHNLHKSYGSIKAVDGLSLEVRSGEIFGLLGPNGAGKTTTIHMAVGLLEPDEGDVRVEGAGSPSLPAVRAHIGHAPQALALYENLTGEENLRFFGKLQGMSGKRLAERIIWSLEFVNLSDRKRERVKRYSGGMKRRLNLAAALVHDPQVLLLDEPTAGVDPQSRIAIFENILTLKRDNRAVLFTTHYIEEAQKLCDRVGIMDNGRLLAMGKIDELISRHGGKNVVKAVRAGGEERIETDDPSSVFNRLKTDPSLLSFRVDRPTLEDVFLNLTGRCLRD